MNETEKHKIYKLAKNFKCPTCRCTIHGVCRLHETDSEIVKAHIRLKHGGEVEMCRCQLKR